MTTDYYYEQIRNAQLSPLSTGEKVKAYYLKKYLNSQIMSTLLVFTPDGTILTGDLTPERRGCIARGYGLEWFAGKLSPSYLAEKFLDEEWVPDRMKAYVRERIAELERELAEIMAELERDAALNEEEFVLEVEDLPRLHRPRSWTIANEELTGTEADALKELLTHDEAFNSPDEFMANAPIYTDEEAGRRRSLFTYDELEVGQGYPEHKIGWLVAIQRRFAETIGEALAPARPFEGRLYEVAGEKGPLAYAVCDRPERILDAVAAYVPNGMRVEARRLDERLFILPTDAAILEVRPFAAEVTCDDRRERLCVLAGSREQAAAAARKWALTAGLAAAPDRLSVMTEPEEDPIWDIFAGWQTFGESTPGILPYAVEIERIG